MLDVIPVAEGAPRSNRPGVVLAGGKGRTSQIVTTIVEAGKVLQVFQAGQQFYLVLATGEVKIKPNNGAENSYTQGKGLVVDAENQFRQLQVTNPNSFNVVIQLFVGFGDYIDNTVILYNPQFTNAVYGTMSTIASTNNLAIPDKSGTAFDDINGVSWIAIARVSLYVTNYDLAKTYDLKNNASTKTILGILPATNVTLPFGGDLRISDAAVLQLIVSETYLSIRPGVGL